jgi:hypothetical protein
MVEIRVKITKRQLRKIIQEALIVERAQVDRQSHSKLRYALVDYIDAYTLTMGLNPGDPADSKRIHSEIDDIVNAVLGIGI